MTNKRSALIAVLFLLVASARALPAPSPEPSLPAPDHLQERASSFAQRNTPENAEKAAHDLLDMTFLAEWGNQEFRRPDRWAALQKIRQLMDGGNYAGAVELFKQYTLNKLRHVDEYGLSRARFDPYSGGPVMWKWIHPLIQSGDRDSILAQAHDLMGGILASDNRRMKIGEPGQINWQAAVADAGKNFGGVWPWHVDAFAPLLEAYIFTGDRAYLDRWSAYADDWAMNQTYGVPATTLAQLPDQWAGADDMVLNLLKLWNAVAAVPGGADALPATTFARVLARLLTDYPPMTLMYHRGNANGWTELSASSQLDLALFFDEYRWAPDLVRDSLRKIELMGPFRHMPDGGDIDSTVGYHYQYMMGAVPILETLKFRALRLADWQLPAWEKRDLRDGFRLDLFERSIREEMLRRARMLAGHIQANREWPIGGTRDAHENRAEQAYGALSWFVPEAFANPDIASILSLGVGDMQRPPSFTSESLPYSGHNYMRAGWGSGDPYLYMFCSPRPAVGSLSRRNNNAIGVSAFGQDLLGAGDNGPYDEPHSPVRVDGQEQFFWAGVPSWGHRGTLLAWQEPAPWRSHNSTEFDVAEGIYSGVYGRTGGCHNVTHQRLVQFVRAGGFWIVTDRLRSPVEHQYSLDWRFAIQPSKVPTDFTPDQIKVNAADATIKTDRPSPSNVSLYHFPSVPLTFSAVEEHASKTNHYLLHDFLCVSGEWKGGDQSVVVTAIQPRHAAEDDLRDVVPLAVSQAVGFSAVTPGGLRVEYLAAVRAPAELQLGPLQASAESLLLTTAADGTRRGIVLGAAAVSVGGHAIALATPDAEFTLTADGLIAQPIYRPLAPVAISPQNCNVFVGQQTVTLTCATAGAQIRYTCDGSDPTLSSPLYTGPFTIAVDTEVKARAVRPGTTSMPTTQNGTLVSAVTKARFIAEKLHASLPAPPTTMGLHFEYFTGPWQQLLMRLDEMKPTASGRASGLFDFSAKGSASTYAFRYTGYLDLPADGVYTFFAPPESYEPNITAGYDLNISIDGIRWYPATSVHAVGTWSIALQKGRHSLSVTYVDMRGDDLIKLNSPGMNPLVWAGVAPRLQLEGPKLPRGPIPQTFCFTPQADGR